MRIRSGEATSFSLFVLWVPLVVLLLSMGSPLAAADGVYTLQKGDTLYSIARRFEIPLAELLELNGITDPSSLRVGTRITIPGASAQYTVRKGDTLYGIARRHGLTVSELRKLNGLSADHILGIGDRIRVPAIGAGAARPPAITEQTASAKTPPPSGVPYWPHGGPVHPLNGKLANAVGIDGKAGDPVVSVSIGRVTWAAPFRGYGKIVFVKSDNGVTYGYAGQDEILVSVGDYVSVGTTLGTLGVHAQEGIARLFFFATRGNQPLDPYRAPRG